MITLFRRKMYPAKRGDDRGEKLAGTDVARITNNYGRAVLHLNADEIAPKYSYYITMSHDEAARLRDQLNNFLGAISVNETHA